MNKYREYFLFLIFFGGIILHGIYKLALFKPKKYVVPYKDKEKTWNNISKIDQMKKSVSYKDDVNDFSQNTSRYC